MKLLYISDILLNRVGGGLNVRNDEVISLLQHYRHDLMNQVQVIKGYLSMKKYNQVDNKLNEMIDEFEQERKLMGLNASSFVLWLIRFNSLHRNIRVTYNIHTKESIKEFDKELLHQCQQFINAIETVTLESELYHVTIDLDKNLKNIELIISIRGYFKDIYEMEAKLNMLGKQLDSSMDRIIYKLIIPID